MKDDQTSRAIAINKILAKKWRQPKTPLTHGSHFQLLVAVILSAQCTDERVNRVTPALFQKYKTVRDFASAQQSELEKLIYSTGFFRSKAKNIIGAARRILEKHGGRIPRAMDDLLALPGVARKTANVISSEVYGTNLGVVVDTHVLRLAWRLGFSSSRMNAVVVERELMPLLPEKEWRNFSLRLVFHGRTTCTARKPDCANCELRKLCPRVGLCSTNPSTKVEIQYGY